MKEGLEERGALARSGMGGRGETTEDRTTPQTPTKQN